MERIVLTIPGAPLGQPRARAVSIGGHARVYPARGGGVAEFKALARRIAAEVYQGPPLEVPLRVDCLFVFPRTKGQMWKTKPMVRLPRVSKPDRDNLDKLVLDALTGIVWRDDALVTCGWLEKVVAAGDEQPRTVVTISTIEPGGATP